MSIKFRILLVGAASLLAVAACSSKNSASDAALAGGTAAASVNGAPISEALVSMLLKQRADLGRPADAESRKAFIDRLAMQLVIAQEAVKKGMDKAPEVGAQIEMSRQSILVNAFVQDYFKNNPVSDEALKAEYEKMKAQSSGTEYKARHILVEGEAEAKDVIAALKKNPRAFEALARERSRDPGSKARGGDLGWIDPRSMVPEFGAAVVKLTKGRFTEEPVKSQFGYHVILLEDSRQKLIRPYDEIKTAFAKQLQEQNLQKVFEEMKAKAKIEIIPVSGPAAAKDAKPADSAKP
jgi:peptidyl-prolyl cis-trans isomerase C